MEGEWTSLENNFRVKKGLTLGVGKNEDKSIVIDNGDLNKPSIRFNSVDGVWEYSDDGIIFKQIK